MGHVEDRIPALINSVSQPDNNPIALDQTAATLYTLYRQRIFQEYELINHRMMWMVLSQAFMLALWASMPVKLAQLHMAWPGELVAIGGIVVTIASFYSIRAARNEIERHVIKYQGLYMEERLDVRLPSVVGAQSAHRLGHMAPECMMSFVLVLWIGLLILPILNGASAAP